MFYALALVIRDGKSDFDIGDIDTARRSVLPGKIISLVAPVNRISSHVQVPFTMDRPSSSRRRLLTSSRSGVSCLSYIDTIVAESRT